MGSGREAGENENVRIERPDLIYILLFFCWLGVCAYASEFSIQYVHAAHLTRTTTL